MRNSIQIEEDAAAWLVKRDSGEWTQADQVELDAWLAASAHRVAFIRLEGAWRRAERLQALGAGTERGTVPEPASLKQSPYFDRRMPAGDLARDPASGAPIDSAIGPAVGPSALANAAGKEQGAPSVVADSRKTNRRRGFALAASILIAAVIAGTWLLWPGAASYRTPVGGLASVPMVDGSKVTLNTDSVVHLEVTDRERLVKLEQGEAFFEVARDPLRPFVVAVADKRVIAVGTKFSVRRVAAKSASSDGKRDDVRIVVTEGRVRVENAGMQREPPASLGAGAIAHAGSAGVVLQERPVAEAEEALSWRSGYLMFHEVALAEAVAEFNRYNTRKIVIEDPEVAAMKFSANLRATNLDGFVRLLEQAFPIRASHTADEIVLTKN